MAQLIDQNARRLTQQEKTDYAEQGYVKNLPVFNAQGVAHLQEQFAALDQRMPAGIEISRVNMWHKCSQWFYGICRTPAVLDYVEDLIGPDFFQWGGQFFVKQPGDGSIVPWHQDAQYWPLSPMKTVTVWLALYDADESNAAMQVVRGSHRRGNFEHHINPAQNLILEQEVSEAQFNQDDVVTLSLQAGQISLHDDGLLHGSGPNVSDRVRCGLTMRFCPTEVKCDMSVWPTFEAYMARGKDQFRHNPAGVAPSGEGFPVRKFQHSSEFALSSQSA